MAIYKEVTTTTRQNIIDAFWDIYCVKGIDKITVKEIMEKAGYNRGTFYKYFIDVYDVLEKIEDSLLPELSEMPPLEFDKDIFPIDSFIKLYETSSKYYTVLLGEKGDPSFVKKIKNGIKSKVIEQLNIDINTNIEIDYTLEYMLSAIIGVLTYWFQNNEEIEKEKLMDILYSLMDSKEIRNLASKIEL